MLIYSARKHFQLLSKIGGRETNAGSSGIISQCRTDISQIRLHTSATQQSTQKIELGSQHQMSLMETALMPALKDLQASLKQLMTFREIESDDEIRKVSEAIRGETRYRPSTYPAVVLQTSTHRTKQCTVPMCACQCHAVSRYQHPRLIEPLLGSLFIGYSRLFVLLNATRARAQKERMHLSELHITFRHGHLTFVACCRLLECGTSSMGTTSA